MLLVATEAHAQPAPAGTAASVRPAFSATEAGKAQAQIHFRKAKELYVSGAYRDARTELLQARKLDGSAKDLVFNLGIVAEKLQLFDEAIGYFREYNAMVDTTDTERQRTENIIKRIDGAKKAAGDAPSGIEPQVIVKMVEVPARSPHKGRVDAFTITAATIGAVGLLGGGILGGLALSTRPADSQTVSSDHPYSVLQSDAQSAHNYAVYSDLAFGIGIAGAVTAIFLYFARDSKATNTVAPLADATRASARSSEPRKMAPAVSIGFGTLGGTF